jgi:rhodanese-related sulfurtransferase
MKKILKNIVLIVSLSSTTALIASTGFPETDAILAQDIKEDGQMEAQKLKELIDKKVPIIILDVRDAEQRAEGIMPADHTLAISREELEFNVGNQIRDKNTLIVSFCRSGPLGVLATHTLKQLGYKNAISLKGGLKGWAKLGYPIQTAIGTTILSPDSESTNILRPVDKAKTKVKIDEITPVALKAMIDKEDNVIILDVRENMQRSEGKIYVGEMYEDDTYAITRGNLEFDIGNKIDDKDAFIVTYSSNGDRGTLAAQTLRTLGYKNVMNLQGGLKAWAQIGYPIETGLGLTILKEKVENDHNNIR